MNSELIQLEHREESFLRHLNVTDLLHALLASLLFLQKFAFSAHIAAVTLGKDILSYLLDCFAGDYLGTDGCLNGNIELLTR